MKLKEKRLAIELRKKGWMLGRISSHLNVAKSTVSLWIRNVALTNEQAQKVLIGHELAYYVSGQKKRQYRINATKRLFEEGKNEGLERASDSFFVSGLMLYWAEGAKSDESIKFSNSDPIMIAFMMKWFKEICRVPTKSFRISVHIHTLHVRNNIEDYWSKITHVPRKQFYKTQIKKTSLRHRRNILYEGTCTIVVHDINLFRKMVGWRAGVLAKLHSV